jgi:rhodanese-related sulfurtransferase
MSCPAGSPAIVRDVDRQVIVVCDDGYQSSLAAAMLRRFGLDATDVVGGVQAWRAAGRPVSGGAGG